MLDTMKIYKVISMLMNGQIHRSVIEHDVLRETPMYYVLDASQASRKTKNLERSVLGKLSVSSHTPSDVTAQMYVFEDAITEAKEMTAHAIHERLQDHVQRLRRQLDGLQQLQHALPTTPIKDDVRKYED